MNDYYAVLGVSRDGDRGGDQARLPQLARKLHPDVNPGQEAEEEFKKISPGLRRPLRPREEARLRHGRRPLRDGGDGGFGQGFTFSDVMDAFFGAGAATARGPRSRQQRGQDALVRLDIDLAAAVFGSDEELAVDTAAACGTCGGSGAAAGYRHVRPATSATAAARSSTVQRSFLGQVMTSRPCNACQGFGTVIQHPCFECSGQGRVRTRRTLKLRVPAGVDSGTRIQLTGEGEVGPGALNIATQSVPFDYLSRCVSQWTGTEKKPAILSIEAPQARFHFARSARSQSGSPALH